MKLPLPAKLASTSRLQTLMLFAVVAVLALLGGVSGLAYPSPYSPLFVLGALVALAIFIGCLARPEWALHTALVLVFLPLGLIPTGFQSVANRSLTVIAAGVWLVHLLSTRRKIAWTGSALFMLSFIGWSSITLLWADRIGPAITDLQAYLVRFLLFLLLVPNEVRSKRDLDGFMNALACSGWVLMLSVAWILLSHGYMVGSRLKVFQENENGAGMLGLVTMVGVLWHAAQPSPSKAWKVLKTVSAGIFILFAFALVIMSGSRGSAISLVALLFAFWVWKPLRLWGKLGLLLAVLGLILTPSIFTTLADRFAVQQSDTLLGGREALWRAAWGTIQDHPLGGVGIGNAPYAVLSYLETDSRITGRDSAAVHNPILAIWSETGIVGILLYVGVFAAALFSFVKGFLSPRVRRPEILTLYVALVSSITLGYMFSWIKGGGMESSYSYFLIVALLALPSAWSLQSPPSSPGSIAPPELAG